MSDGLAGKLHEALALEGEAAIPALQAVAAEALAAGAHVIRLAALTAASGRLLAGGRVEDAAHAAVRAMALGRALGGGRDAIAAFAAGVRALRAMEQDERADEALAEGRALVTAALASASEADRAALARDPDLVLLQS